MKGYHNEVLLLESLAEALNSYDFESLKLVKEAGVMGVPTQLFTIGLDRFAEENHNVLSTGVEQINMVAVDRTAMVNFFENIYNSDELFTTPLTTPLKNTAEIEDVRSNYLDSFIDTVNRTVAAISKRQVSKDFLKSRYINPSYLAMTKRQIVKSTLTELDYKNLVNTSNQAIPCAVTEEFFTITVLPFLRTYNDEVKQMTMQAQKLMTSIDRGASVIGDYMKTYNTAGVTSFPDGTAKLMSYYLFNIARMFMEISGYASYMLARKMNAFAYNVNSLLELYRKIISFFPENNASFHENVVDGSLEDADDAETMNELMDGDASMLKAVAYRIRDSHQFAMSTNTAYGDKFHSLMDQMEDQRDYDLTPYTNTEAMMTSIIKSIYTLEANCKDQTMTFDELKEKAGLNTALINRFASHVAGLSDISVYTGAEKEEDPSRIFYAITNELRGFSDEMDKLAEYVHDIHNHVDSMDERIFSNVNDEFATSPLIAETRKFVNDFKSDFQDLVTQIVQAFFRRLRALDEYLQSLERSNDDQETEQLMDTLLSVEGEDFVKEAVMSGLLDDELLYRELVALENTRSYIRSLEKAYGVQLLTEADEGTNNSNTTQTTQTGGGNEKKSGEPEVSGTGEGSSDNSPKPSENNDNPKTGENEGEKEKSKNPENKKANITEMIKKMAEFFEEILKKFLAAIDRQLEINKKWLAAHKEELLGKKIRNKQISNVYPYADDMPTYVVENIRACTSIVNGLTAEKVKSMDNAAIDKALFGFMAIHADIPIRDKMVQWYTTKDREMKTVTLKNAEIERRMKPMIDYCETFYNGLYKQVSDALRDLKNAWSNKAKTLGEENSEKIMYINKQIKYYAGTILNCVRDRNYAYLKILKTFVGGKPQSNANQNNKNDQNNDQNQETNNNEKQNNESNESQENNDNNAA